MSSTFEWAELVTNELVDALRSAAGIDSAVAVSGLVEATASALASTGHLPVVAGTPDVTRRTLIARQLLGDAFCRVLDRLGVVRAPDGILIGPSASPDFENEIRAAPLLHVNIADETALEALPILGRALARRIVAERQVKGAFRSMRDLVDRVSGLAASAERALSGIISFLEPVAAEGTVTAEDLELEQLLVRILKRIERPTREASLLAALHLAAVTCASTPMQAKPHHGHVEEMTAESPYHEVDFVVPLQDSHYYYALIEMLELAASSISVAMFHVALPAQGHPTRTLLDALVAAKIRGVSVRILLDRDKAEDPYHSTLINAAAKKYLRDAGIDCRSDAEEVLMHSKLVILDERTVVIGSHNWSAGSYFQFDDASVAITSASYAAMMKIRFDEAWSAAV